MLASPASISPHDLYAQLGTVLAPVLVDVRRRDAFAADDRLIVGAFLKGAEFGHVGDRCLFDAIVRIYDIHDPALDHLATIVRGADTSRPDLTSQCEGLLAISYGLSANFPDDFEMLGHGMGVYDALYTRCRSQAHKQH